VGGLDRVRRPQLYVRRSARTAFPSALRRTNPERGRPRRMGCPNRPPLDGADCRRVGTPRALRARLPTVLDWSSAARHKAIAGIGPQRRSLYA
jgi:hypothetical protein